MPEELSKGAVLRMVPKTAPAGAVAEPHAEDKTPVPMLEDVLARVRAGLAPHMMVVEAVYTDPKTNSVRHIYWSFGVAGALEHLGMLELAKHSLLTEREG